MKKLTLSKPRIQLIILGASVCLLALLIVWMYIFNQNTGNRAAQIIRPMEQALIRAGGTKKSAFGDSGRPGRMSDSTSPHYRITYLMPMDRQQAIDLAYKITHDNGYSLTHASPADKGPLASTVDDKFIDMWYFDDTSKRDLFPDIESGPVKLFVRVEHAMASSQANATEIYIEALLPEVKR